MDVDVDEGEGAEGEVREGAGGRREHGQCLTLLYARAKKQPIAGAGISLNYRIGIKLKINREY